MDLSTYSLWELYKLHAQTALEITMRTKFTVAAIILVAIAVAACVVFAKKKNYSKKRSADMGIHISALLYLFPSRNISLNNCKVIATVIILICGVAFDPMHCYLMYLQLLINGFPQIQVLKGVSLAIPVFSLPSTEPLRNAFNEVLRVAI